MPFNGFIAVLAVSLVLDFIAIRKLVGSNTYSKTQKIYQIAIVALIPILGALLVLFMATPENTNPNPGFPRNAGSDTDAASIEINRH